MATVSCLAAFLGRAAAWLFVLGSLLSIGVARPQAPVPCGAVQQPMCYGEYAACSISPSTNVDVYQFIGVAGETLLISMAGQTPNLGPQIELYDPLGVLAMPIASCSPCFNCTCTFSRQVMLAQSGMYTLVVTDAGANNAGSYTFEIQRIVPLGLLPILTYGQTTTASINYATDHDWLTIEAAVGTQLRITSVGLTPNLSPLIDVFDSGGQLIATTTCNPCFNCTCSPPPITINPTIDETYYVMLSDGGNNNTGDFNVTLSCIFGQCPPPNPPAPIGTTYCTSTTNSSGMPATISAVGSKFVANNDVHLIVSDAPPAKLGIFFVGSNSIPSGVPLPYSCGLLCVQQPLVRRPIVFVCNDGDMHYQLDLTDPFVAPLIAPGVHAYFQAWFRDPAGNGSCSQTTNTSNGLDILFM